MKLLRKLHIGRGADCDIHLQDDTVSRRHARLELLPGARLQLTDLGSSNGTWLLRAGEWQRLVEEEVSAEAQIRLGEHEVSLRALLADFPAFALVFEHEGPVPEAKPRHGQPDLPRHKKPRRNARTGDIEDLG